MLMIAGGQGKVFSPFLVSIGLLTLVALAFRVSHDPPDGRFSSFGNNFTVVTWRTSSRLAVLYLAADADTEGRLNQLKLLPFNLRISSITQKPGAHHSSKGALTKHLASLCLGALFTLTALSQAPPTSDAVYVQQPGHWRRLYVAPVVLTRVGDGSGSTKIFSVYRDPHATTAVKGPRPVFSWSGFNDNISPRDVLVVRLAQKKDHREMQYATSDPHRGITPGYLPQDRVEVQVRDDGNLRTVTPKADLAPGEYMLFTGAPGALVAPGTRFPGGVSVFGFDFQVVK
jgi:hypothetical protein